MSIRIRFGAPTGSTQAIQIERLSDGQMLDFTGATGSGASVDVGACSFTAGTPAAPTLPLPESTVLGVFKLTLTSTGSGRFTDGDYSVTVIDQGSGFGTPLDVTMFNGDDTTQPPNAVNLSSGDKADIISGVSSGVGGSVATATASQILDVEQTGGGTLRKLWRAVGAALVGKLSQSSDGSMSSLSDWADQGTQRISSTNGATSRDVTINP